MSSLRAPTWIIALSVALLLPATPALAQANRLLEMSDRLDRNEVSTALDEARNCTAQRRFDCAAAALAKADKTASNAEDRRRIADTRQHYSRELELHNAQERTRALEAQLAREREDAEQDRLARQRNDARRERELREAQIRNERRTAERDKRERDKADARAAQDRRDAEQRRQLADHQQRVRDARIASDKKRQEETRAQELRWQQQQDAQRARSEQDARDNERQTAQEQQRKDREARERELTRQREERERTLAEQREREAKEREQKLAEQREQREREQRDREAAAQAKRDAEAREKRDALDTLRNGTRLAARRCIGGEGRYFIVGTVPQAAKNKLGCVDVSWSAHCPGEMGGGIRGTARNFVGAATDCYMGDTVPISPTPSCPVEQVRVEVTTVQACR